MKCRTYRKGMTLIELMVVVAIIAVLAGLLAFYVAGGRNQNAQVDMFNELNSLLVAQRMRASGLGLATYVVFDSNTPTYIQPKVGTNNLCTFNSSEWIPIRYSATDDPEVAIDITPSEGNDARTLDSMKSNRYVFNGSPLTSVSITMKTVDSNNFVAASQLSAICFQPNGSVYFVNNGEISLSISEVRFIVDTAGNSKTGGVYHITTTSLGMIETEPVATPSTP